jgi:hypothetical protein
MRARLENRVSRRARERTRRALRGHPLLPVVLDAGWYVSRYRDVFWAGASADDHFLGPGLNEGRDPGPLVDLSFVRSQRPGPPIDDASLLLELLDHGLAAGWRPSPYVDLSWYAREHAAAPDDPVGALRHLVEFGLPAGQEPGPFVSLTQYATRVSDVEAGGVPAFAYFTALGQHLGRFPHPIWDEPAYLDTNEYVRFALGMGKHLHGFEHFCAAGHAEVARGALVLPIRLAGRSEEYSEERYLAANPDVAALVTAGEIPDGITHFFASGHREVEVGMRSLGPARNTAHLIPDPRWSFSASSSSRRRGRDLLLLVHHDPHGRLDPHVRCAIDAYREADIEVQVVTSRLDEPSRAVLADLDVPVHSRSTNDDLRDFGAWHLLLAHLGESGRSGYERVILANDSAYFPVQDPEPFLAAMRAATSDLWGATDSFSGGRYHLQSFFLALNARALAVLIPELAHRVAAHSAPTKLGLIQWFEIGLSQFAADRGLSLDAFVSVAGLTDPAVVMSPSDPRPLSRLAVTVTNLTHHFWLHSLRSGLPFLKVELLRDNPVNVDIGDWQTMISGACDAGTIEDHLSRVRR